MARTNDAASQAGSISGYRSGSGDAFFRWVILAGFLIVLLASWKLRVFNGFIHISRDYGWLGLVAKPSMLWGAMGMLMLAFRTVLWFRYRTPPLADFENAPSLTVVIPAYNEGRMVARSIESVVCASYPRDRLQIVVIDDGSSDDTWQHIERVATAHRARVTTLRFPQNRGKRAALEAGFLRARGDVIVTIDSDSVIEADTLLAMAGPFRDPRVGAVAGKVAVYNCTDGLIPRMLKVRFALSFDFLRAAQSTYGTVYCCPGALAGYRSEVVRRVLPRWSTQKFCGAPCTYGEDRALTNDILEAGYDCIYQRAAVVHTLVPSSYARLCRMFLRWDRSYVREELRFLGRIVWKRPRRARFIAVIDSLITNLRHPIAWAALLLLGMMVLDHPVVFLRMCCAIMLISAFNMLYYLRGERSWDFIYGIAYSFFSAFALFWIFPYALCTVRAQGWLTR